MNKSLWLSALLLLALSSCLKSNDDEEQVYYHDTALTSFKLGTLKRILHTTSSSGEDSTYSSTVLGAAYAFTIDQQKGLVYNVDSLPVGTDVSKVIFTASTKNSGSLVLNLRTKDGQRDSLKVYSTTDSIDFTNPVEFRVYNQSGTTYRKYSRGSGAQAERQHFLLEAGDADRRRKGCPAGSAHATDRREQCDWRRCP